MVQAVVQELLVFQVQVEHLELLVLLVQVVNLVQAVAQELQAQAVLQEQPGQMVQVELLVLVEHLV